MLNPVVISIPIFALLIAIEAWYSSRKDPDAYLAKDAWNNILIGFVSVGFGFIFGLFIAAIYAFAYSIAPYKFPAEAWWSWVILFFADDLAYYIFHRVSHESRLFWNFHVVHHSSQFYNLSVAVRQSWFGGIVHWLFYAPLMLLGFAPWMFVLMHGFNLIHQFWILTKFIHSLGPLEHILNTPSHHRVHHGVNGQYLDKNYAGVLIIWDRIFGTYIKESEEPRYGIIKPVDSFNPLWINTHGWVEMWFAMRERKTVAAKLRCMFASPNMDKAWICPRFMKSKFLFAILIAALFSFAAFAQAVTITAKKDVMIRPKARSEYKKSFSVTRPIAKAATPLISRKINMVLAPEKVFDLDLNEEIYRSEWLDSIDFETLYNKDGIICVKEWMEGSAAYPDGVTRYVVVDSKTGNAVNIPDAFNKLPGLAAKLLKLQQAEVQERIKELKGDPETKNEDMNELFGDKKLKVADLKDYSVSADGVTFYYEYGFPHVIQAFEPLGEFKLSWAELKPFIKPGGLLARFVR